MSPITLILIAIGLGLVGWLAGRAKAWSFQKASPDTRPVARPIYHAWYVAVWVVIPLLLFITLWSIVAPQLVIQSVLASPAAQGLPEFGFERGAWLSEANAVARGHANAVFNEGALLSIGDGHGAQGYGEVSGSAVETSLQGEIQVILHKNQRLRLPRAETPTHYMTMGLDRDLDQAAGEADFQRERKQVFRFVLGLEKAVGDRRFAEIQRRFDVGRAARPAFVIVCHDTNGKAHRNRRCGT